MTTPRASFVCALLTLVACPGSDNGGADGMGSDPTPQAVAADWCSRYEECALESALAEQECTSRTRDDLTQRGYSTACLDCLGELTCEGLVAIKTRAMDACDVCQNCACERPCTPGEAVPSGSSCPDGSMPTITCPPRGHISGRQSIACD